MQCDAIEVVRASTHNLKSIDCRIPHGKVTVVTGPSGAGKSSLAFDTVYAEAQRRFIESMSTYARQFLEQVERPPVESMTGILPAVALVARNTVKNARSTVGTMTEAYDVLRLLFAHLGRVQCPQGHGELRASTAEQAADLVIASSSGEQIAVLAPIVRPAKPAKRADAMLAELVRQGYFRILVRDRIERLEATSRWPRDLDPLPLVVGRVRADGESRSRLTAAIEDAYRLTGGRASFAGGAVRWVGQRLTCPVCGETSTRPQPALFSFNSPLGACPECQGFGRIIGVDRERVVPDVRKTLREKPIAPWNSPSYEEHYDPLWKAARRRGVRLDVPWRELDDETREWIWTGKGEFLSIQRFFDWLERRSYKMHVRILLARYRAYEECRSCRGRRLRPESLAVLVKGRSIADLARLSVEDSRAWLASQTWEPWERDIAAHLLDELGGRLDTLHRVGLDYLTLDRQARTLAGGEAQRIQLASALGSGLTSTLYVLDEPTIGLHPQDSDRLLALLRDLAARGNTVLVVEHDRTLIQGADHVIDLGPRAGEHGGEVIAEGPFEEILRSERSLTAAYLRNGTNGRHPPHPEPAHPAGAASEVRERARMRPPEEPAPGAAIDVRSLPRIGIRGATENNLRGVDVDLPVGCLVAVTGVSGSGKSTLIHRVLHDCYQRSHGVVDVEPGRCSELVGLDRLEDLLLVDQRPLGRSSRSNPVTYSKAYDEIRKLFASTPSARREGITAGHFSFNLDLGRCPDCEGTGVQEVDMQFMAPVEVTCDRCQGRRFLPRVLAVTWGGLNVAETLELTVDQARTHFASQVKVERRLGALAAVGLGYLRLGQSTATLSGGEAQRLKLATFLEGPGKRGGGKRGSYEPRLFLFDEPTTGLHMADIDLLHQTLRRLIERGDGVVVIEHSLDLIARADWIVDLGPGGGEHGGALLFSGPRQDFVESATSPTATELRRFLRSS
jgi:excinuclease ABC subunit A